MIVSLESAVIYYLVWLLVVGIYSPIFYQLYNSSWSTIDYTHAYFVLPVALWSVWQKRQSLKEIYTKSRASAWDTIGLAGVLIGLIMFYVGWRQGYMFISTLSVIPVLWGTARFLYGGKVTKALRFPLLYLFFLIPPPLGLLDAITVPMRYGISGVTESILRVTGYPIERSGLMLNMAGNDIFMGAPCSGFRSLITMFALAVAYVYFIGGSVRKQLILIPAVVPFALLGNLVRVLSLCLITYYAGQEAAEGFFHDFSGGLIFVILIVCLMGLENRIDVFEKKNGLT